MPQKSSKNNNNGVITAKKWDHGWNYDIINLTPPLLIILSLRFKALCFHPRSNDISVSRWLVWCLSCSTDCTSVSQTTDRRPTMFLFSFPLVPPRLSSSFISSSPPVGSSLLSCLLSSCLLSSTPISFPHVSFPPFLSFALLLLPFLISFAHLPSSCFLLFLTSHLIPLLLSLLFSSCYLSLSPYLLIRIVSFLL